MVKNILNTIINLSKLHFTPFSQWNKVSQNLLDDLLEGLDYFITPEGNVFLGVTRFKDIHPNRLCLQAHLDHPGGVLMFDQVNRHMHTKLYGHNRSESAMVGRQFGVFEVGKNEILKYIEVEHCSERQGDALTLFFKPDDQLMEKFSSGELSVHYAQSPSVSEGVLSAWALDDLLNVAIIIEYMKEYCDSEDIYGLITVNEEVGHLGIKSVLKQLRDKSLFYLNMDVIDCSTETERPFGFRTMQGKTKLDLYIPEAISEEFSNDYFVNLGSGGCEGMTLINRGEKAISLYVKIENLHNGIMARKFYAEMIEVEVLREYTSFVKRVAMLTNEWLKNHRGK